MIITVDCRHINSSGGIETYFKGLLPFLLSSGAAIFLLGDKEKIIQISDNSSAEVIHCKIKPFSLRDTFAFPKSILKKINSGDIFYTPYFNIPNGIKVPVYSTIHDIIFLDIPNLVTKPGFWMRLYFYRRAARLSKAIFTVSEFSKLRINYFLGDTLNIINASNAVNVPFQKELKNIKEKEKTVIFMGNIKKHKGLNILIDAFIQCRKEGLKYKLVIIGSQKKFRSRDKKTAKRLNMLKEHEVSFSGYINDDEKWKLLAQSTLLVQPSLYEGFGYPPLEAMLLGTKALISDIKVFKEVYSDFPVVFFQSGSSKDLHDKLHQILSDRDQQFLHLNDTLIKKYTFEKTASVILKELKSNKDTP
ncbi:MAG: glycosyltransferase family 4 protein [Treponema sp.]|jgi:glycosyltransferase involved in cell wall biosynthesis|nr:glycosyltransferase family 4 protein [Treponema sp.]